MNSLLVVLSFVAMASAVPLQLIQLSHTQASEYSLKTDHPVQEPPTIIKGVPQPYAVPVPQPYAVPRAVPVAVPRAVPVTVTRTVGVPVVARGEPIVRTRVIQSNSYDNDNNNGGLGGLSLDGGYGRLSLDNGYGDNSGYGNSGYGDNNGYGNNGYGDNNGYGNSGLLLKGLSSLRLSKY